ncbi:hypothetical protein OG874_03505 [Nocardia sp. NBC_00565]|uniref:DNA sulfur modification protein DndB n=1 Tax=Nocardia sp. NBC_00565 TaxID=2975993 RepID=UPI002E804332|nr:DNA sulfur modification protein DndB [Nocardia sp. NBC_00565]WUC04285.1 hypothetical protein OG874_03505 [Nocardia sp. NBC_00565]
MTIIENHMGLMEHDGVDKALTAASADAAAAGARVFPCTVFQQGQRTMISTSFPYSFLSHQVVSDSVDKGGDPTNTTNRPLMTDHVKNINSYMRENQDDYILPPVTLNARQLPALHVPRGNFKNRLGFMVIGDSVQTLSDNRESRHRSAAACPCRLPTDAAGRSLPLHNRTRIHRRTHCTTTGSTGYGAPPRYLPPQITLCCSSHPGAAERRRVQLRIGLRPISFPNHNAYRHDVTRPCSGLCDRRCAAPKGEVMTMRRHIRGHHRAGGTLGNDLKNQPAGVPTTHCLHGKRGYFTRGDAEMVLACIDPTIRGVGNGGSTSARRATAGI